MFQIEGDLEGIYLQNLDGILSNLNRNKVVDLEARKLSILKLDEERWRQKSRAIWLDKGDLNTKFFHSYVDNRRVKNFVWEILNANGQSIKG